MNAVSGGMVDGETLRRFPQHDVLRQAIEQRTPFNRLGTAEEIADVVVFLCSGLARFITGQNLVIDGGMTLHGSGVDGLLSVSGRRVVGAVRTEGPLAFCRGVEVSIRLDEDRFTGGGLFLFASVLERFLALYWTMNSFTKLIATVKGREGELRRWPPRMGENLPV